MDDYIAHSENEITGNAHLLRDHLKGTAIIAEPFGRTDCELQILKFLSYIHDLGKYRDEFQKYIREGGIRGSVHHAIYGAYLTYIKKLQIASFCISGHHKGIPDLSELKNDLITNDFDKEILYLSEIFYKDTALNISQIVPDCAINSNNPLIIETYIRFFFSCLVDSDWLDTESHFSPGTSAKRVSKEINIPDKISILEKYISRLPLEGEVNNLRNMAREHANKMANAPVGFYSLNLPTGLGKTLCSVSWALRHALFNRLKRVIIVLPYTSIIDQSAKLLKMIFSEDDILEHHSNFEYTNDKDIDYSAKKLSAENWDFPFILTTSLQFFESVFSNKPSKCRKVHNIADSVVIFDEVQTFPKNIFLPTITMLKNLRDVFNTSFLFCTATQPAFLSRNGFDGIDEIVSLVNEPSKIYKKTKRVKYFYINDLEGIGLEDIIQKANEANRSTLMVFNRKSDALSLYNQIQDNWDAKYHLSTWMCPTHRKEKIELIKKELADKKKKIIVCSTQLIEAGVDLDFPVVFRALAPLDSIIQSAGRCNREGKLSEQGKVFVFKLLDHKYPDSIYEIASNVTEHFLKVNDAGVLHQHDTYAKYFMQLDNFVKWDRSDIDRLRREFLFDQIASAYKIISSPAKTVVVEYKEGIQLIKELKNKPNLSRDDYRKLQLYSVQLYPNQFEKSLFSGLIYQAQNGMYVWIGEYAEDTGIVFHITEAIDYVI